MSTPSFGRVSSFGQRAEMERRGLIPAEPVSVAGPPPVEAPAEQKGRARSTVEITVTPILDRDAMMAIADEVTATIRDAFQRGFSEGVAEAERQLDIDGP